MRTHSLNRWLQTFVGVVGLFSISAQAQLTIQLDVGDKSRCEGVAQVNISQGEEWLYSTPIPVGASAEFRMNAGKYKLKAVTPDKCVGHNEFEYDGKHLHLKTLLFGQTHSSRPPFRKPASAGTANSSGVSDFSRGSSAPVSQ